MKYQIYVKNSLKNEYDDTTVENMYKQLEKLETQHGKDKVKLIKIPENIKVGYEVYKDGKYYGAIVGESESLWYVKKPGHEISSPFMKESFINYFISKHFDAIEDIEKEVKTVTKGGKKNG